MSRNVLAVGGEGFQVFVPLPAEQETQAWA